jgi:hypothetical protein
MTIVRDARDLHSRVRAEVAVIEDALPSVDPRTTLELRIRSIPVTVASGRGALYSDDLPGVASLR